MDKKLPSQISVVSATASGDYIVITLANGTFAKISVPNLRTALLQGIALECMTDGVFIMCHKKSDNSSVMFRPESWKAQQASGEVADGVVVVEGGRLLVVAPTESPTKLFWSSAAISGGGFTTTDRVAAYNDWTGKTSTAAQIAASTAGAVTNTASYAPGFCNLYSRTNANGQGLTAGKWWLPSIGELLMMSANFNKINYALSLITGAEFLKLDAYWSSSENSSPNAWFMNFSQGFMGYNTKTTGQYCVRPVSAFIA
ncbi:Lcl domain-containing protein [Bacteroides graminisolvens]|uniref:Lcl C-terminal domain-containing protein n=2 Tax=Bacteroides graminisolvens TaxID=477666 RepID=A0A069D5W6_9BACE|nr:DUF1566 domain-containing protein [Bacteroides graminisolvens]GAK38273.1 hypothetical protein JCM15093_3614 [Bacteroides graminisolvens DSM 19988 = JCM 15093]